MVYILYTVLILGNISLILFIIANLLEESNNHFKDSFESKHDKKLKKVQIDSYYDNHIGKLYQVYFKELDITKYYNRQLVNCHPEDDFIKEYGIKELEKVSKL